MKFLDRRAAGQLLANKLNKYYEAANAIVLALPRGGLPVAEVIADSLNLPLDILIVRKIGLPEHPEYAIGAIAANDVFVWNESALPFIDKQDARVQTVIKAEYQELKRREQCYRGKHLYPDLTGKTVILVDDGIATGTTVLAAITAIRKMGAKRIILAVPVAAQDSIVSLHPMLDEVICLYQPKDFNAVGCWYVHFDQVSDEEVITIMEKFL